MDGDSPAPYGGPSGDYAGGHKACSALKCLVERGLGDRGVAQLDGARLHSLQGWIRFEIVTEERAQWRTESE
jgi:hypothetical protein